MFSGPIGAVLVDVGGTLWPNTWPLTPEVRDRRVDPVALALGVPRASAAEILSAIIDEGADEGMGVPIEEPVDELIARVLARRGLRADAPAVRSLRHALCLNLGQLVTPFPFAGDLLRGIKRLGARCVIVSNTTYRDAEMYHRDFEELGWSEWIDECVTSIDVGCSKPDLRIFEAAIAAARCTGGECAMVGDSEKADIAPAVHLGMRSILVTIGRAPPASSPADACAARLDEALAILTTWQPKTAPP